MCKRYLHHVLTLFKPFCTGVPELALVFSLSLVKSLLFFQKNAECYRSVSFNHIGFVTACAIYRLPTFQVSCKISRVKA